MDMRHVLLGFICFFALSCGKYEIPRRDIPDCIHDLIQERDPGSVIRYDFQGQVLFEFRDPENQSDQMQTVFLHNCEILCSQGGIGGLTECSQLDFYTLATNPTLVWEK